jgi:hypothetical protein
MAFGANIDIQLFPDRAGLEDFAAGAAHSTFIVIGMQIIFHLFHHLIKTAPEHL